MYTLYTSKNCNHCKALKEYLHKNNINFEEKVLDQDFNTGDLIAETSRRGSPTLSFPVLINGNSCYTTRQFIKNGKLDEMWLEENLW